MVWGWDAGHHDDRGARVRCDCNSGVCDGLFGEVGDVEFVDVFVGVGAGAG